MNANDPTVQALETKRGEIRAEILRLEGEDRAIGRVLDLLRGGETATVHIPIAVAGDPHPAFEEPPRDLEFPPRKGRRRGFTSPNQGRPWNQPGNADYWRRKAAAHNVDTVRELLKGETEGVTQKAIAEITGLNTATVSRAIVALWKYGELEFLGRTQEGQGKGHRTTNVWRLWTGEGSPPDPESRWGNRV